MTRKKAPFRKKTGQNAEPLEVDDKELGRFAGSSDEDDESDRGAHKSEPWVVAEHDADGEESESDEEKEMGLNTRSKQPFVTNDVPTETEPGQKMAGVMAKILGTATTVSKTSSVVLAKTTTPLQRLQRKEKEKVKALKLKRQANRERNLTALHIPLSVATSNNIDEGRISITKELEQERFHRRVATRGVVALFNAISQHQNATEDEEIPVRKDDSTKMTKHGFLDKIKSTAAIIDTTRRKPKDKTRNEDGQNEKAAAKWDALKDDFMMKPKKNWDEESSDENASDLEQLDTITESAEDDMLKNKRRKIGGLE